MGHNQGVGGGKLEVGHVVQLVRLLADARDLPAEGRERASYLVSGVARILGATIAGDILYPAAAGDGRDSQPVVNQAWEPMIRALMRRTPDDRGAAITATWDELVAEVRCETAVHAGLVHALFSSVRLRTSCHVHGLGLYRDPPDRPFSEEDRNLLQVFHTACESLLHVPPRDGQDDDALRARLSPRQRETLQLVLSGLCDKEIAERLGISRHTVNQYTKIIYRHYAVTSRAQLLARLLVQPQSTYSLIAGTGIAAIQL